MKRNAKPRFELGTDRTGSSRTRHSLPARGRSARYTRELSFARCHDEAGCATVHGIAVDNTSRTGRSTSPAAEVCGKIPAFETEDKKTADFCA